MREPYPTLLSNGSVERQSYQIDKTDEIKSEIFLRPESIKTVEQMSDSQYKRLISKNLSLNTIIDLDVVQETAPSRQSISNKIIIEEDLDKKIVRPAKSARLDNRFKNVPNRFKDISKTPLSIDSYKNFETIEPKI